MALQGLWCPLPPRSTSPHVNACVLRQKRNTSHLRNYLGPHAHESTHTRVRTSHSTCKAPPHTPPAPCTVWTRPQMTRVQKHPHAHTYVLVVHSCSQVCPWTCVPMCTLGHPRSQAACPSSGLVLGARAGRLPAWEPALASGPLVNHVWGTAGAGAASVDRTRLEWPTPATEPKAPVLPASTWPSLGETDLQPPTLLGSTGPS